MMGEQVEVIALEERQDRYELSFTAGLAVAALDTANDACADSGCPSAGSAGHRVGEQIGAIIGGFPRLRSAIIGKRSDATRCR